MAPQEWHDLKIVLTAEGRWIYIDGVLYASDAVKTLPILWGVDTNVGQSVKFDNLKINTYKPSETIEIPEIKVENAQYEDGKVSFTVLNAYSNGIFTADAYVAEYDKNSHLAGVTKQTVRFNSDSEILTVDYTPMSSENRIRMFLWEDMRPVTAAADILHEE